MLEALNNMMVQSDGGIIEVFPVWREDYDGKFSTIREKGAFLVSSEMKDNTVQYIELTSEKGTDAKIVNPWGNADVTITDSNGNKVEYTKGETVNSGEKTIEFATEENTTYTITESGVDKTALEELYSQYKDESGTGYVKDTWELLQSALDQAETVLDQAEASQEEVDAAYEELQAAISGLRASKTNLEYFLNKAKEHVANGDTEDLVESVQKLFEEAITEGEAVMADESATKEEVFNAAFKLMKAIQALGFKAGDKTDLEMALDLTQMIDLDQYVEEGQAEYLSAKENAEAVMADGDAMQEEVNSAWQSLTDAMSGLRLKADKAALEELLDSVAGLDLSKYTEESAEALRTALASAQQVFDDPALSEDDQQVVDNAVAELEAAEAGLVEKPEEGGGSGETPGGDEGGQGGQDPDEGNQGQDPEGGNDSGAGSNIPDTDSGDLDGNDQRGDSADTVEKAVKTGDTASATGAAAAMMLAGVLCGAAVIRKRREK